VGKIGLNVPLTKLWISWTANNTHNTRHTVSAEWHMVLKIWKFRWEARWESFLARTKRVVTLGKEIYNNDTINRISLPWTEGSFVLHLYERGMILFFKDQCANRNSEKNYQIILRYTNHILRTKKLPRYLTLTISTVAKTHLGQYTTDSSTVTSWLHHEMCFQIGWSKGQD